MFRDMIADGLTSFWPAFIGFFLMSQLPVLDSILVTPLVAGVVPTVLVVDDPRRATVVIPLASSGLFAGWGPRLN